MSETSAVSAGKPRPSGPEAYPFRDHKTLAEVWRLTPAEIEGAGRGALRLMWKKCEAA